jgi:5,10-methylenetetrahydrofolate reductase
MDFQGSLANPGAFVTLYGTTPPRADAPEERVIRAATRLAARIAPLPIDGLVVYDVQDEDGRTTVPRPFPYLPTTDPRAYSRRLHDLLGKPVITYKCIVDMTEETWEPWLAEAQQEYGVRYLSLVGLPTARGRVSSLPLSQALKVAAQHPSGFTLGGVTIAERHGQGRSESARMLRKAANGCAYFISQAVYATAPTIGLLSDYARECAEAGVTPRRVILTFTPAGRPKTLDFIRWLGVTISDETATAILDDPAPLTRSIAICRDHLRRILDQSYTQDLPLGLNIESVSIFKDEIDASIELCQTLHEVAREYGLVTTESSD